MPNDGGTTNDGLRLKGLGRPGHTRVKTAGQAGSESGERRLESICGNLVIPKYSQRRRQVLRRDSNEGPRNTQPSTAKSHEQRSKPDTAVDKCGEYIGLAAREIKQRPERMHVAGRRHTGGSLVESLNHPGRLLLVPNRDSRRHELR